MKVLYVRNLKDAVTEETLKELFGAYGEIERVKKLKDYAFVHFKERDPCTKVEFLKFKVVTIFLCYRLWRKCTEKNSKVLLSTVH